MDARPRGTAGRTSPELVGCPVTAGGCCSRTSLGDSSRPARARRAPHDEHHPSAPAATRQPGGRARRWSSNPLNRRAARNGDHDARVSEQRGRRKLPAHQKGYADTASQLATAAAASSARAGGDPSSRTSAQDDDQPRDAEHHDRGRIDQQPAGRLTRFAGEGFEVRGVQARAGCREVRLLPRTVL